MPKKPHNCSKGLPLSNGQCTPHSLSLSQDYLAQRGISVVHQSPYSPYFNLIDQYLFRAIKQDLKNDDFDGTEAVGKAIQRSIRQIPENTLLDQLKNLRDHCHLVIGVNGDYVLSNSSKF